jgi:hypothetical protein
MMNTDGGGGVVSFFSHADQALKSAKRSQLGRIIMKRRMLLASAATMGMVFLAAPANAQGVQQTVPIAKVDVQTVAAGYRASKVIGSSVLNEAGETIARLTTFL